MKMLSVSFDPEDRKICEELLSMANLEGDERQQLGDWIIRIGKYFLGTRYAAKTLETRGEEVLVVNLKQFDCSTFLENVIALARLRESGMLAFRDYTKQLRNIRYRKGRLKGYGSRLHYFTDWLYDNKEKGILRDITGEMGGMPYRKNIAFMTRHPEDYPHLKEKKFFKELMAVEKRLSERVGHVISKNEFERVESGIENGDVIAITTNIEGLDVTHVGFAIWFRNNVHLMHASEEEKRVAISGKTLRDTIKAKESVSGIIIARVQSMACGIRKKCSE
jgi:hypothetical protein